MQPNQILTLLKQSIMLNPFNFESFYFIYINYLETNEEMCKFIESIKYTNESVFLKDIYRYFYGIVLKYGESSKFLKFEQNIHNPNLRVIKILKDIIDSIFNCSSHSHSQEIVIEKYIEDNIIEVLYSNMFKYLHLNEAFKYTLYSDDYIKAIDIYESILNLESNDFNSVNMNSYIQLILLYYNSNQHNKLSKLIEHLKLCSLNKKLNDYSLIYFCLGVYSMLTKIERDTLNCFNKALEIKESFLFILTLTDMFNIQDGIRVLEFGIMKYPNYLPLKLEFCKRMTNSVNNNENNILIPERVLKECLKDNMQLPLIYNEIGHLYLKMNRFDEANNLFKEGLRLIDEFPILKNSKEALLYNLATNYFKVNNFCDSLSLLLKIETETIDSLTMIGMCYHANRDFTNAYYYYNKAHALDTKNIIVKECINKLCMS